MANYATNIFYARTENKADLDKIEAFLDDTFDGFVNRHSDSVDAEFTSRWVYPEEEIDRLIASLEAKDKTYYKISGITSKNGRNDAKRLNIRVVTMSNDDKPKNRKTQRKADLRRRMVCKSLPVKE